MVHPSDELYGADRVLVEAVSVLEEAGGGPSRGAEVRVLLPRDVTYPEQRLTNELRRRGVPVRTTDVPVLRRDYLHPRALPALLVRTARGFVELRRERPDVVYLSTSAALLVAPLARLLRAHVVVHVHETWSRQERVLLGPLLRLCHTVVAVSDAVASGLPLPGTRVTVVHNGFDVPRADDRRAAALRDRVGARPDDLVVLVASRWNAWKGHELLLEAWGRAGREDAHLVVLGAPPPSGQRVDVAALASALPDPGRVHVVGESTEVPAWVLAADVVAVPSTRPDPLPTIAIEAAALGRAVLAADSGGLPDIVEDGVTGSLVPTGDVDAWTDALRALDRSRAREQGTAAARRFRFLFTRDAFRERLADALDVGTPTGATTGG
ncbi:glycosyltransferase family 4 protein [Cellulomonas marina]|uniref:D-inositol 3-phosphate glycosyltransferase n=1 Tax=Cellulomonas marina TaxID=988821 RepID=A0A1I0X5E0_9CELL|nr:glycosyltransferase family 4 protein [Cellulomonas marina]SFA95568.1 Glycosyltransferase involved in cell wall bisynthesis [Cellulomonas marina]